MALRSEVSGPGDPILVERPRAGVVVDHFFKGGIELNPLATASLSQQHFGIQTRAVRLVLLQIVGRPGQQSSHGPRLIG